MKSGSGLHSEGNEFTSIKVEDAKATFKNTVICEGAMIQDESAACILGEWNILGESEDKIDLGIMNRSVVYGDTLTLNHVNSPNIRMTEDSNKTSPINRATVVFPVPGFPRNTE